MAAFITTHTHHIHICGWSRSCVFSPNNFHRQMMRRTFSSYLTSLLLASKERLTCFWKSWQVGLLISNICKNWTVICLYQLYAYALPSGSQEILQRSALAWSSFLKSPGNGIHQTLGSQNVSLGKPWYSLFPGSASREWSSKGCVSLVLDLCIGETLLLCFWASFVEQYDVVLFAVITTGQKRIPV